MKKSDMLFSLTLLIPLAAFIFLDGVAETYHALNQSWGIGMSMLKFAILATMGEMLGLRIRTGLYRAPGFGVFPRAIIWAGLGAMIHVAFVVFAAGIPVFLESVGVRGAVASMSEPFSAIKLLSAFSISVAMNAVFAPFFMTIHRVTDTHIAERNGRLRALLCPLPFGRILADLDWDVLYGFVFKKTIPLFWVPAHTITFLLPAEYRVLAAAILSVILGVILAVASLRSGLKTESVT